METADTVGVYTYSSYLASQTSAYPQGSGQSIHIVHISGDDRDMPNGLHLQHAINKFSSSKVNFFALIRKYILWDAHRGE